MCFSLKQELLLSMQQKYSMHAYIKSEYNYGLRFKKIKMFYYCGRSGHDSGVGKHCACLLL